MNPLVGAKPEHQLLQLGVFHNANFMRKVGNEARGRQHFIAFVDPSQKLGRSDIPLNRAELHAFDLPRNRSQLACRINLAFDSAAGVLFDHSDKPLAPLVLRFIDRGSAKLHDIGLILSPRRVGRCKRGQDQCDDAKNCSQVDSVVDTHSQFSRSQAYAEIKQCYRIGNIVGK